MHATCGGSQVLSPRLTNLFSIFIDMGWSVSAMEYVERSEFITQAQVFSLRSTCPTHRAILLSPGLASLS